MHSPVISVIIPCFNAQKWIRETLESVRTQDIPELEIIVVDDGSTDDSVSIIEGEFPYVHLVKTQNRGPSKARNLGTKLSKGEFIQYLDADDLLALGKLKIQLEAIKESGDDVAYGDWQKLVQDQRDGEYVKKEIVKRRIQNPEIDLFTDFWCPPAVYLFRRSIVERIGGWNENLPVIQDARFALDCALQGASFVYCSGVMAYYRVHLFGSVSSRDSVEFVRDCFRNAAEVEAWWKKRGEINEERKKALVKVYGYVARQSFERDRKTFDTVYQVLEKLSPGYVPPDDVPTSTKCLRIASKLLGYKRAETLALSYRRCKLFFRCFFKRFINSSCSL